MPESRREAYPLVNFTHGNSALLRCRTPGGRSNLCGIVKHTAHLVFAMLLTPTVALVAGIIISVVGPEHRAPDGETVPAATVQAALPAGYLLYGDLEQQP
jgi:hypothetical protein